MTFANGISLDHVAALCLPGVLFSILFVIYSLGYYRGRWIEQGLWESYQDAPSWEQVHNLQNEVAWLRCQLARYQESATTTESP